MLSPGGKRTTNIAMASIDLSESHSHPRWGKQSSRHFVQDRACLHLVVVAQIWAR